jgi:trans-2-enoyl-CoA reductase
MNDSLRADDQGIHEKFGISNFGALEARVEAFAEWKIEIKDDIAKLGKSIDKLGDAITELTKPKWVQWIGAAALFLTAMIAVLGQMASKDSVIAQNIEYSREILQLQDQYKFLDTTKMTRMDMTDLRADMKAKIDELNARIDIFNHHFKPR